MSPLVDTEQVVLRLQTLKDYFKILKMLQKFSFSEVSNDPFKKGALLHYLQLSAEICIDIGQIIISAENFEIPQDSAQIIIILGKEKILPKSFANDFSGVARFKNLLVHEYIKIDMKKVYEYLNKNLNDFDKFAVAIAKYLKKK